MPKKDFFNEASAIACLSVSLVFLYGAVAYFCWQWHLLLWKFGDQNPVSAAWVSALFFVPFLFLIIAAFSFAQRWEGANPKAFHRVTLSLVALGFLFPAFFYCGEKAALQNEAVYSVSHWLDSSGYVRYLMIPDFEKKVDLSGQGVVTMEAYLSKGHIHIKDTKLTAEAEDHYYYYLGHKESESWLDSGGSNVYYEVQFDVSGLFLSRGITYSRIALA
jgi:hypothetical protein